MSRNHEKTRAAQSHESPEGFIEESRFASLIDLKKSRFLSFGTFQRKIIYKAGCTPGVALELTPEVGGVEELVLYLRPGDDPQGSTRMVEIAKAEKFRSSYDTPQGNPQEPFIIVMNGGGNNPAYFVEKTALQELAAPGKPLQLVSGGPLGDTLQGDMVEKVTGFLNPVGRRF